MTFLSVLMSLVGLGLVALGASLVATARPRSILLNRRNRGVPALARWNGAAMLVAGGAWLATTWFLPPGSNAAGLVVALMFLALVVYLFIAERVARRTSHLAD
jgi:hypothetical protein